MLVPSNLNPNYICSHTITILSSTTTFSSASCTPASTSRHCPNSHHYVSQGLLLVLCDLRRLNSHLSFFEKRGGIECVETLPFESWWRWWERKSLWSSYFSYWFLGWVSKKIPFILLKESRYSKSHFHHLALWSQFRSFSRAVSALWGQEYPPQLGSECWLNTFDRYDDIYLMPASR